MSIATRPLALAVGGLPLLGYFDPETGAGPVPKPLSRVPWLAPAGDEVRIAYVGEPDPPVGSHWGAVVLAARRTAGGLIVAEIADRLLIGREVAWPGEVPS